MAWGARHTQVLWMVLRESLIVVIGGLAARLPAALVLTRYITSMRYGVKAYDATTIALTVLVLSAAGSVAGLLPASRAERVDPIQALHFE